MAAHEHQPQHVVAVFGRFDLLDGRSGYIEVAAFNDEPHAHHWFEKSLDGAST
jgi:hypothetical protein